MVRIHPDPPTKPRGFGFTGAVAQLGEHLLCKQGVVGSIPISSTTCLRSGQGARRELKRGSAKKKERGQRQAGVRLTSGFLAG